MQCHKTFDEVKLILSPLTTPEVQWERVGDEHKLRQPQGVAIRFNEAKGLVYVTGNPQATKRAHAQLKALLKDNDHNDVLAAAPLSNEDVRYAPASAAAGLVVNSGPVAGTEYRPDIDSEIVVGVVATVGTNTDEVFRLIADRLKLFKYSAEEIKISRDILEKFVPSEALGSSQRINRLMDEGNRLRKESKDLAILAKLAAGLINKRRYEHSAEKEPLRPFRRKAFVISSLKHPDEVQALRKIYSNGFFLVGVHANKTRRINYLTGKGMREEDAQQLVDRDEHEADDYGQHTRDTFHLSDFFINYDGDADKYNNEIVRVLNLIFGHPFVTPTFDEFAMFMAFSASLRSADLSRQVGAVVTRNNNIVSTGANDVPRAGGGLYWAERSADGKNIVDAPLGRDFTRGVDANVKEKQQIIDDIVAKFDVEHQARAKQILEKSKLKDITEYGRVAHAEMEALLACGRNGIPTIGSHLYCTTFPCHNCAKHIIASGVRRVVYVEPYPKSKALEFHSDSITFDKSTDKDDERVLFEPFVGVGPRSFFNLFSTSLGSGSKVERKTADGLKVEWTEEEAKVRMQMLPSSYIEREAVSAKEATQKTENL